MARTYQWSADSWSFASSPRRVGLALPPAQVRLLGIAAGACRARCGGFRVSAELAIRIAVRRGPAVAAGCAIVGWFRAARLARGRCGGLLRASGRRPGLVPGLCRGKAHRHENLGYAGRRVLVSRKWSGKTLADHRADRKAWLTAMLDLPADDNDAERYSWERVDPADPDYLPATQRLLHVLADRSRWRTALAEARRKADRDPAEHPTDGRAA
jgi:hypothetical protein